MAKKTKSRRNRNASRQGPLFREAPIAQAVRLAADKAPGQWDVLNDMYLKMLALMDHWIRRAAPVLSNPVLLTHLGSKEEYCALLIQFRCDMEQLSKELVQLHQAHTGMTGGTDDPDENLRAAMLFEQYVMWQLRHDQTLIPIVNHLLEFTHDAELALAGTQPGVAIHFETAAGVGPDGPDGPDGLDGGSEEDNAAQVVEAASPRQGK
ncbi:hypothetical protein HDG34_003326 [Paraburkholderia sp. HC6.4b]|uniref:hypothetical protein n=1 Tax=unclassified Paraburkholderia TaxID=2615204 RepID=UPI00161F280D|nr:MULTISPECIES: hypothetical protein [unclassified Paraburkholderia]MBB5409385.1 hypothetical protein [Paraburkholderia sp. HC6.4b]MBB5451114.1 hypothetical protein [Paraburkholderia sp. Kb1A]